MRNGHNLAHLFHGTGIAGIAEHRQAVETGDDLAQNFEPLGGRIVVTGEEVSVIFDIMPDTTGNGLHFEFEMAMITREELCRFGEWPRNRATAALCIEFAAPHRLRAPALWPLLKELAGGFASQANCGRLTRTRASKSFRQISRRRAPDLCRSRPS